MDRFAFRPYTPQTVAQALADHCSAAVAARGSASLAIPGGRSPGPVLEALAGILPPDVGKHLHLLWVDERSLPFEHPDRNDNPTMAAWRRGGPLPGHIHPMPADHPDLEAAAACYASTFEDATHEGRLDACLIGIGEDCHIASLFPNHPLLRHPGPVAWIADSPKPPSHRLTLALPVLARARHRLILALGAGKRAVTERVHAGDRSEDLPASLLPIQDTIWYCDQAALPT